MKFLCEHCKAKYQVADDKVAGKTVRMKCRKCGHPIEVRATTSDVTVVPPPAPAARVAAAPAAKPPFKPSATTTDALSGAFVNRVQNAPVSATNPGAGPTRDLSSPEPWFVGINGAPVGPLTVEEFRQKASHGAITHESLCWREGLDEWRPVGSVPELVAIVRDATRPARPPAHAGIDMPVVPKPPPVPTTTRLSRSGPAPTPPPRPVTPTQPAAPAPPAPPAAPSPSTARRAPTPPAAPAPPEPLQRGMTHAPDAPVEAVEREVDPFAIPRDAGPPAGVAASKPVRLEPAAADASSAPSPSPVDPAIVDPLEVRASPPRGSGNRMPLWMWPVLVLALGFGLGLAAFAFRQPPPAPVIVQAQAQAPVQTAEPTATASTADTSEAPKIDLDDPTPRPAASDGKPRVATGPKATAPKTPEVPEKKGLDLGSLVPGGGGPNVGPGNAGGGSAGGSLDQATVERIVAGHRTGVKRTCWERGGVDQKSSVNVTVTTNIAANGSVASTSSSGDDPVVGKCIENQVRAWRFPASGSTTTINIPFKFVRQ